MYVYTYLRSHKPSRHVHVHALNQPTTAQACGKDYFSIPGMIRLDPDFLLTIARELIEYAGTEPAPPGEPPSPCISKASRALQPVATVAPGLIAVQLLLARSRYLSRDFEGAQHVLTEAIQADATHYDSHLLMAQIFLEMGKFREANTSLEQALSHNFEIRESANYYMLRAMIHEKAGQWADALKVHACAYACLCVLEADSSRVCLPCLSACRCVMMFQL
jgi:hypothetical protein